MKLFELKELMPDVKTLTPKQLAKKHKVSLEYILKQVEIGTSVEMEHTKNKKLAREISMDHISEKPNYYQLLKKVEK